MMGLRTGVLLVLLGLAGQCRGFQTAPRPFGASMVLKSRSGLAAGRPGSEPAAVDAAGLEAPAEASVAPGGGELVAAAGLLMAMNLVTPTAAVAVEAWVQPLSTVLTPAINVALLMFLVRTVLSWYPSKNLNKLPWNLVAWPTEPVLAATRRLVPPAFGVDITPIVWIFILSFINEVLLGPQGLFTIMQTK